LRLVVDTQLRNASEAFHFEGELPMVASAQLKPDFDGPEDRQLADDIARVMQHRPLMSRLARVDNAHGNAADAVSRSATRFDPTPVPTATEVPVSPISADQRSIEEVIDDLAYVASPPPSAEWLDKARHTQRQERRRFALAWITTIAIAGAIVTSAFLLLRA
jgi:hypothetical protein